VNDDFFMADAGRFFDDCMFAKAHLMREGFVMRGGFIALYRFERMSDFHGIRTHSESFAFAGKFVSAGSVVMTQVSDN
jgi:hypothetical protein